MPVLVPVIRTIAIHPPWYSGKAAVTSTGASVPEAGYKHEHDVRAQSFTPADTICGHDIGALAVARVGTILGPTSHCRTHGHDLLDLRGA
jgi:hypothetical protein